MDRTNAVDHDNVVENEESTTTTTASTATTPTTPQQQQQQPMTNPSSETNNGNVEGASYHATNIPTVNVPVHAENCRYYLDDIPPPKADFSAPPPYEVATKLPTYEEVQREKHLEGEPIPDTIPPQVRPAIIRPANRPLPFLTIDAEANDTDVDTGLLGTDFMFFTAFFVAFIFNWIGFLLLMCFCHTIASRYGALSGFGLSLAKWTLIVKHSTDLASRENSWLWWLIMIFGLIICIRAIIQYLNIKRGWRLLSNSHQERLLFFY